MTIPGTASLFLLFSGTAGDPVGGESHGFDSPRGANGRPVSFSASSTKSALPHGCPVPYSHQNLKEIKDQKTLRQGQELCIILSMLGDEEINIEFECLPRFVVSWFSKPQAALTPSKEKNAKRLTAKSSSRDWRDNSPAEHSDESQTFKS